MVKGPHGQPGEFVGAGEHTEQIFGNRRPNTRTPHTPHTPHTARAQAVDFAILSVVAEGGVKLGQACKRGTRRGPGLSLVLGVEHDAGF